MNIQNLRFSIRGLLVLSLCLSIGLTWWLQWKHSRETSVIRKRLDDTESKSEFYTNLVSLLSQLDSEDPAESHARSFILRNYSPFMPFDESPYISGKAVELDSGDELYVMTFKPYLSTHFGSGMVAAILRDYRLIDIIQTSPSRKHEYHYPSVVCGENGAHFLVVEFNSPLSTISAPLTERYSINPEGFGTKYTEKSVR